MRKRCCNSSGVNWMASTSALVSRALLLLTVALLLLECVVWCDMVGFAKHEKDNNNKIVKLGTGEATDCEYDKGTNGDIIIKYKKGDKHATKGCSIDLLTRNQGIQLEFSVTGNLMECLTDAGVVGTNEVHDERAGDDNLFPYTFSLQEGSLDSLLKDGPKTGAASECSGECVSGGKKGRHGKCLLSTEFAVAFGRRGDKMLYNMHILGEPRIWYCYSAVDKPESVASLKVNFEKKIKGWQVSGHDCNTAGQKGLDYDKIPQKDIYCTNPDVLRKAEEWEIKDEAHKDEFKYLFTLNILPLKVVPAHSVKMQALDHGKRIDGNKFPKCELSLRLSGNWFKLLGAPPGPQPSGTPGPDGSTGPAVIVTGPVETTTTAPPSEASGSNLGLIIGIVIAVVVL
uniref:Uncharacterized protein n=1 Tax=Meloidogyne enterolobii TaxID=390850 RepID=A0A6V7TJY7_MELEN|nr:unnamed protein product [Meloidogyne enterolobii]